jgi:hypothetical protein
MHQHLSEPLTVESLLTNISVLERGTSPDSCISAARLTSNPQWVHSGESTPLEQDDRPSEDAKRRARVRSASRQRGRRHERVALLNLMSLYNANDVERTYRKSLLLLATGFVGGCWLETGGAVRVVVVCLFASCGGGFVSW